METFKIGEKVICIMNYNTELELGISYQIECFGISGKSVYLKGVHGLFRLERFKKLDYDFADGLLSEIKENLKHQLN